MQGRDLRYAIAGTRDRVTRTGLARIRASAAQLTDPTTSAREARAIAAADPAILWIAGNVHGGEESGTDASLRVLWELADRSDCAATRILDEAVVVILPIQNPDGREADTRRNAYGFDMDRDWFARTQPETDGKVEMLRRYPPQLFIDAHEMGNPAGFFFPQRRPDLPRDARAGAGVDQRPLRGLDPARVRRPLDPVLQLRDLRPLLPGLRRHGPDHGVRGGRDDLREDEHRLDAPPRPGAVHRPVDLAVGGRGKQARDPRDWHETWVQARRQGRQGLLEPNEVDQPENTVQQPVPDVRVRHYFVRADDPAKAREVQALVRRLQRMDVQVRRLRGP